MLLFVTLTLTTIGLTVAVAGGWQMVRAHTLTLSAATHADDHRKLQAKSERLQDEQAVTRQAADDAQAAYTEVFGDLEFPGRTLTDEETGDLSGRLEAAGQVEKKAESDYTAVSRDLHATNTQVDTAAAALFRATAGADQASGLGSVALFIGGSFTVVFGIIAIVLWFSRGKHDAHYTARFAALEAV
ncbi:hypothetical protein [Curtobacterium sp. MCBD17_030]|uniref:hypothetical protein n=1 Tax=Curtobacterium sp. MCBD17_030 TaxID=2175649 RepID=UPI000D9DCBCE|nr:hypothetical protein [Curtobacterium sp. MCBD17_030]PYY34004.1 hypothetical protein DEI89_09505 [Curtobacterium sp. MCBD17_030]